MQIRIEASSLPGRHCPPGDDDFPGYDNIHVAVQRRGRPAELFEPYPGDAPSVVWTLDCATTNTPAGLDVTGAYIQGRPGGRFVYLSWGAVDESGAFTMFRRAKLMLDAVEPAVLDRAELSGRLVARLGLTDCAGRPLCAAVRPPSIEWSACRLD